MSISDYQTYKEVINTRLRKLEEFVGKVELYKLLLEEKTKGYLAAIKAQSSPYEDTWFYITKWFRSFIGIKDEAMLLINGELVRKYHKQVHESFIHSRGREEKYYKTVLLGLSGCSIDGLNYDLRKISEKYPSIAVSNNIFILIFHISNNTIILSNVNRENEKKLKY